MAQPSNRTQAPTYISGGLRFSLQVVFISIGKPFFRYIQAVVYKTVAIFAGISGKYTGLAIVRFAKYTAILSRYTDRIHAFFRKITTVYRYHCFGIANGQRKTLLVYIKHFCIVP